MSGAVQESRGHQRRRVLERSNLFSPPRQEWTLGELFTIFRRRRALMLWCMAAAAALAALYCVLATPRFLATGQIEVQKSLPGTLGLDRNVIGAQTNADTDSLDTSMTLQTDAQILQSSALALTVVKDLNLETTEDYFPVHRRGLRVPGWVFFWREPVEPPSVPLDAAPNRRYVVLRIFASHLKVVPVTGTRLIDVSYSSPDPRLASAVVNRLIAALQEYAFQSRFQATAQASEWLAGQLTGLKQRTEDLQQAADRLEQGTGIYGDDESHNLVLTRLQELNSTLSAAESNRILKQSVYEVAKSGDPEMISGLAGNAATGAAPAMVNSLALLQSLRGQEAQVQAEIDEYDARYGNAYPKIAELHAELAGIQKSIQEEIGRIGERAHTDYEVAAGAEDAARTSFEKQKEIANATNDRTVAYELAKQEADGSRNLYQGLLARVKEAGVLEGLRSTNLTVVNAGMIPPTNRPHSPNVPLCFAAALAGGLFLGCVGALLCEATDKRVRSIEDLERSLGVCVAGVVPISRKGRWLSSGRRNSDFQDVSRELRRSFALPARNGPSQALLVTSAVPRDGKSRMAASLAMSLAHSGARVLLVDADLHSPSLHSFFGKAQAIGLAEALRTGSPAVAHAFEEVPGLSILWAGNEDSAAMWNPAHLLGSRRMEEMIELWRAQYDVLVLDSAPVLSVPDAAGLARLCDRTVLVVRYEGTTMSAAQRSYRMIERNLPEHGEVDVVMNGVPADSPDYIAYYGYRGSGYGGRARANA